MLTELLQFLGWKDTYEVKELKNRLQIAYFKNQNPPNEGRHKYKMALMSRPSGYKPCAITSDDGMTQREAVAKYLPDKLHDFDNWERFDTLIYEANEQIKKDLKGKDGDNALAKWL